MKKTMVAHAGRTGGKFVDIDFGRVGSRAAVASYRSGSHTAGLDLARLIDWASRVPSALY